MKTALYCNVSGHGEHKTKTLVGRKLEENDEEQVSAQEDILGDVLVSVTGEKQVRATNFNPI